MCEHDPKVIHYFLYDGCEGMVVWCKKCGAHSIHDEYTHDKDMKEWNWVIPSRDKEEVRLDKRTLQRAMEYFSEWVGFELTQKQFVDILKKNPYIEEDLMAMGPDTSNREAFMDAIAKDIAGCDWPCGGTSDKESRQFFIDMKVKGLEKGYDIPEDYDQRG